MRLIDADAFIQMMEEKCDHTKELDEWVLSVCRGGIKSMPTIQPEIVRCEECLYRKICSWEKQGAKFCSFAEKREVTE